MPKSKKRKTPKKKPRKTQRRYTPRNQHQDRGSIAVGVYATIFRQTPEFRADITQRCNQEPSDLLLILVDSVRGATFELFTIPNLDRLLAGIPETDPSSATLKILRSDGFLRPQACIAQKQLPSAWVLLFNPDGSSYGGAWIVEHTEGGIIHHQSALPESLMNILSATAG